MFHFIIHFHDINLQLCIFLVNTCIKNRQMPPPPEVGKTSKNKLLVQGSPQNLDNDTSKARNDEMTSGTGKFLESRIKFLSIYLQKLFCKHFRL